MVKIFNKMFGILKLLFLIASFIMTLFILLNMYASLEKEPFGNSFLEFISVFIPFVCLLILFIVNFIFKHKTINDNVLYNITCFIVLLAIAYMDYRALKDTNLVLWYKTDYHINFDYFADQIFPIKAMLYGLSITNIFLIIENKLSKKKELNFED